MKQNANAAEFSSLLDFTKVDGILWSPDTHHSQLFDDMQKIVPEFEYYPIHYRRTGRYRYDRFPYLEKIFSADDYPFITQGFIKLKDVKSTNRITSPVPKIAATLQPNDPIITYTNITPNGPTGKTFTHNDILATANRVGELLKLDVGDRVTLSVPLHNVLGHAIGIWSALAHGSYVVIPSQTFDAEEHIKQTHEEHCTAIIATPENLHAMLSHENLKKYNLSKVTKLLIVSEAPVASQFLDMAQSKGWTVSTMRPREKAQGVDFVTPVRTRMGFTD
jgi:fatty-acyl-CoA synthase